MSDAGEMGQWEKCFTLKYTDRSLDSLHSGKCQKGMKAKLEEPWLSRVAKSASAGFYWENMFPYMGCGVLEEDMKQHLQEYTYIYVRAHTREHAHT